MYKIKLSVYNIAVNCVRLLCRVGTVGCLGEMSIFISPFVD